MPGQSCENLRKAAFGFTVPAIMTLTLTVWGPLKICEQPVQLKLSRSSQKRSLDDYFPPVQSEEGIIRSRVSR